MNINEIMLRDIETARREAEEAQNKTDFDRQIERRENLAETLKAIVWAIVICVGAAAAFAAGYAKCAKDIRDRAETIERELAEQEARAEASARAMTNAELLRRCAETEAKEAK